MRNSIKLTIPLSEIPTISRAYLDNLLWGTKLEGSTLLNLDSFELKYFLLTNFEPDYIPVLALFGTSVDPFDFRKWSEDNWPDNENDENELESFEIGQEEVYDRALDASIILLDKELTLDLDLIKENWDKGVYLLDGC